MVLAPTTLGRGLGDCVAGDLGSRERPYPIAAHAADRVRPSFTVSGSVRSVTVDTVGLLRGLCVITSLERGRYGPAEDCDAPARSVMAQPTFHGLISSTGQPRVAQFGDTATVNAALLQRATDPP